jgi:hypothetical protein
MSFRGHAIIQAVLSPLSNRGGPDLRPGQVTLDLWWTKWHWNKFPPQIVILPATPHLSSSIIRSWYNRPDYEVDSVSLHPKEVKSKLTCSLLPGEPCAMDARPCSELGRHLRAYTFCAHASPVPLLSPLSYPFCGQCFSDSSHCLGRAHTGNLIINFHLCRGFKNIWFAAAYRGELRLVTKDGCFHLGMAGDDKALWIVDIFSRIV